MITKNNNNSNKTNKKKTPFYKMWSTYLYLLAFLAILFLIYILFRISISERKLFSLTFFPLLLGIIYENRRSLIDWFSIAIKALGALIFSFLAFLPEERELNYVFEKHFIIWPYTFLGLFVLFSLFFTFQKVVPKLNEGISLIQSISILYWLFDLEFFNFENGFLIILILIPIFISLYSLFHAFSNIPINIKSRLYLSVFSSIIMIIFSFKHIFRVITSFEVEEITILNGLLILVQFFILGVASMYIIQNLSMLAVYLPDKYSFYDKAHMKAIRAMNKMHIDRYSDKQVTRFDSIFCIIFCLTMYVSNHKYQFVPRHTAIWIVFLTFPLFLYVKNYIINYLNRS